MSRKSRRDGDAGFTLIETLIALAIVAAVLGSIGAVIGTAMKGTRAIDQRLSLAGTAEALLASLPSRDVLKSGRQQGATGGHRWRIDVGPLATAVPDPNGPPPRWMPLAIDARVQAPGGGVMRLTTIRLVQRPAQ